jgi:imidazolonepropionase-like amidohydrolase
MHLQHTSSTVSRRAAVAALIAATTATAASAQAPAAGRTAVTNVTVIDVTTGRRSPARTVLIEGGRITGVGPTRPSNFRMPTHVVDGRGKYLIPGLWDMHVHLGERGETALPLLLAYGVTGARDLHLAVMNATARAVALRDDVTTTRTLGPRLVVGTIVAGPDGAVGEPTMLTAATAEEGRAVVRSLAAQRANLVKVRGSLDRATYFAILDEARRIRLPVDGHVAYSLGAAEASDAGQRTIEHVEEGVLAGCTARDSAFRAEIRAVQQQPMSPRRRAGVIAILARMSEAIDSSSCLALGRRLAANGTAFTPTIAVQRLALDRFDLPRLTDEERRYVPPAMQQWHDSALSAIRPDTGERWRRNFRRKLTIVPLMHRAGVTILAGTDFGPQGYFVPGLSLHQELGLLVEAGLTPLQALQTATVNPARAMHATDSLGTISIGKVADLVLLDADPTLDVANARRVRAVFVQGRYLDRPALDTLLARAARTLTANPLPAAH